MNPPRPLDGVTARPQEAPIRGAQRAGTSNRHSNYRLEAIWMGIKQAAVSGLESRGDLLLSTLASYLAAAGAKDVVLTARLGEKTIEVALPAVGGEQP